MKRVYVIMRDFLEEGEWISEPIDVVSSMTKADVLCYRYEEEKEGSVYYWREVISSED